MNRSWGSAGGFYRHLYQLDRHKMTTASRRWMNRVRTMLNLVVFTLTLNDANTCLPRLLGARSLEIVLGQVFWVWHDGSTISGWTNGFNYAMYVCDVCNCMLHSGDDCVLVLFGELDFPAVVLLSEQTGLVEKWWFIVAATLLICSIRKWFN